MEKKILNKPYYYSSTDLNKLKTFRNKIGNSIPIIYNPNEPEKFVVKSEKGYNYLSLVFATIVSLVFIVVSLLQLFNLIRIEGMY